MAQRIGSLMLGVMLACLVMGTQQQTIPVASYSMLSNYASNSYFQAINKKMIESYPSYLSQATINSVYMYSSQSVISFIITYATQTGSIFRATVNYSPITRQLNIESFGPVAQRTSNSTAVIPPRQTTNTNDPGIGITKTPTPLNQESKLIPGTDPNVLQKPDDNNGSSLTGGMLIRK